MRIIEKCKSFYTNCCTCFGLSRYFVAWLLILTVVCMLFMYILIQPSFLITIALFLAMLALLLAK